MTIGEDEINFKLELDIDKFKTLQVDSDEFKERINRLRAMMKWFESKKN